MILRFRLLFTAAVIITVFLLSCGTRSAGDQVVLRIGHVGHDHHTALYAAALNPDLFKDEYGLYLKEIRPKELYEMYDGDRLITELELTKVKGGAVMPTAMSQGLFDVGFGGLAAIAFFVDKGSPMKIISPLHSKGDMLVVGNNIRADNWDEFVHLAKNGDKPLKIGFKAPKAIALLIFEAAMREEGITFTYDAGDTEANVLLVNMKGAGKLNPALGNDLCDGYVCNNPYCAIAEEIGVGRAIADLNDLPPGLWKDHPCCVIGAMEPVINEKREALVKFLELITIATDYINEDPQIAVKSASSWIGTSEAVETNSIPTSMYLTEPNELWLNGAYTWVEAMDELGHLQGSLKGRTKEEALSALVDISIINEARNNVSKRKKN